MIRIIFSYLLIGFLFSNNIYAQNDAYVCRYLFASSSDITQLSTDAISLAVDAVWEASGITGVITTTGTLTQNPSNPDIWTYSANPNDRLILNFATGVSVVFTFYSINGYTGGNADDFKWSHIMDFNTFIQNQINIRINSNTYPQDGKIYWQRTITGNALFDSQNMTVNISHTGNIQYEIGNGFAFYTYTEQASGSSITGSFSINVNEGYWRFIGNNSNESTFVMNTEITNNSSGNFSGTTYGYQNAKVFWAAASVIYGGYYDKVIDANQWIAQGTLLKNGQAFGTVQFDGPVINGTYGPDLVLHLNKGTDIFLHTLIDFPTSIINNTESDIYAFEIMQSYPNPFNSVTKIRWQLDIRNYVTLKVYDVLGNEIETLVDEELPAGLHEVNFNANNLSSGIFFYTITAGDKNITKKMILLK